MEPRFWKPPFVMSGVTKSTGDIFGGQLYTLFFPQMLFFI